MKTPGELLENLNTIYNGEPWFGESLLTKVSNVTEAQAFQPAHPGEHTIAEIVSHMEFWRRSILAQLRGDSNGHFTGDNPENWPELDRLKKRGWAAVKKAFEETQSALVKELGAKKSLPEELAGTIAGTLQHDVYHIGQIGLVKKLVAK